MLILKQIQLRILFHEYLSNPKQTILLEFERAASENSIENDKNGGLHQVLPISPLRVENQVRKIENTPY